MIPFELGRLSAVEINPCSPASGDSVSDEEEWIGTRAASFSFSLIGGSVGSRTGLGSPLGPWVETGTGAVGLDPVIMLAQLNRLPSADEGLADLGLVGEEGGIEGWVGAGSTGPSDVFLRPFALA